MASPSPKTARRVAAVTIPLVALLVGALWLALPHGQPEAARAGAVDGSVAVAAPSGAASPDATKDPTAATAAPDPDGPVLLDETFEDPALPEFVQHVTGAGTVTVDDGDVVLGIRRYDTRDRAYLVYRFTPAERALRIDVRFKVPSAGCDTGAAPSNGNVPVVRLLDGRGHRHLAVMRQNGDCGDDELMLVQTGATYAKADARIELDRTYRASIEVRAGADGEGVVTVSLGDDEVFRTTTADLGARGFARLVLGNDSPGQQGAIAIGRVVVSRLVR